MTHYTLLDYEMNYDNVQPGDTIEVLLEGKVYITIVDDSRVQRFKENSVLDYMSKHDSTGRPLNMHDGRDIHNAMLNLNTLIRAYHEGLFDKREWCEIVMEGYSVSGFCDLNEFGDWHIQNPAWGEKEPNLICPPDEDEEED